jgi:hypothetical protein
MSRVELVMAIGIVSGSKYVGYVALDRSPKLVSRGFWVLMCRDEVPLSDFRKEVVKKKECLLRNFHFVRA